MFTRREFIKRALSLGGMAALAPAGNGKRTSEALPRPAFEAAGDLPAAAGAAASSNAAAASPGAPRALVIVARRAHKPGNLSDFYKLLLDASMKRLSGAARIEDAWARFFEPGDVVAIKVNSIAGNRLSSSPLLVNAITDGLVSCGVRP
ncbi:MAG: hypothetical protein V2A71_03980, partial [Candidatus Eisenbacteria bacterium]